MKIYGFYVRENKKEIKVKEIQIDVDKVIMKAALTLIMCNGMTRVVYAGPISESVQPIVDILKDLAEPVAYGFMIKGFLSLMAGNEHEGKKTIKYAISGYLGIQLIPKIFNIIKNLQL